MENGKRRALAYLLGVYLSDGTVQRDCWRFTLQVKDREFVDVVSKALNVVGVEHTITQPPSLERVGMWQLRVPARGKNGKRFCQWLVGISERKERLPTIPDDLLPDLVAGVMDGDGCVHKCAGYWGLSVAGKAGYLQDLASVLVSEGVRCNPNSAGCPTYYVSTADFLGAGLFFRLPRKQKRLIDYAKWRVATTLGRGGPEKVEQAGEWLQKFGVIENSQCPFAHSYHS